MNDGSGATELARVRQALRDGLVAGDAGELGAALTRLWRAARGDAGLTAECERWSVRLALLRPPIAITAWDRRR